MNSSYAKYFLIKQKFKVKIRTTFGIIGKKKQARKETWIEFYKVMTMPTHICSESWVMKNRKITYTVSRVEFYDM